MERVIKGIKGLEYGDALVGLRIELSDGVWDVDNDTLKEVGLTHYDIKDKIRLKLVGDLLISEDEEENGENITDISENQEAKEFLRGKLIEEPWSKMLRGFQMPWKMSLQEFMVDDSWEAIRVERTDEYKNQHNLKQPDGTLWRWGWIGSARSPETAKWNFHKEQVRYALHRGDDVADVALVTYPEYVEVKQLIKEFLSRVSHDGEVIHIKVAPNTVRSFNVKDCPDARYAVRDFVSERELIPQDVPDFDKDWFNLREITCIAIEKYIRENNLFP